jgi:sec-independent protein translocase protein TatA
MLGFDNPIHLIFLLIPLLLVFGAKRLPEMGRSVGSGIRGFKESLSAEPSQPTTFEQSLGDSAAGSSTAAALANEPGPARPSR